MRNFKLCMNDDQTQDVVAPIEENQTIEMPISEPSVRPADSTPIADILVAILASLIYQSRDTILLNRLHSDIASTSCRTSSFDAIIPPWLPKHSSHGTPRRISMSKKDPTGIGRSASSRWPSPRSVSSSDKS